MCTDAEQKLGKKMLALARRDGHRAKLPPSPMDGGRIRLSDSYLKILKLAARPEGVLRRKRLAVDIGVNPTSLNSTISSMFTRGLIEIDPQSERGSGSRAMRIYATEAGRQIVEAR